MGFLDSLFTSETKKSNEKRLVEVVDKIDDGSRGIFASIMDDLGTYVNKVGEHDSSMRKMAYAYARRFAAAGLCAQGLWGQEEFDYQYNIFKAFQQNTAREMNFKKYEDTIAFQEEACHQGADLVISYDSRLTKEFLDATLGLVMQDASRAQKMGIFLTIDQLLEIFQKMTHR